MKIAVKVAKPDEWQIIQKLNHQVYLNDKENDDDLDLDRPFSESAIAYYKDLASGGYGKCFIAFLNEIPVGYIALSIKFFGYRKSKYVEIENIGVDESQRSKGIGKLLMDKASKWAKEQNATKLYVSAYFKNQRAIDFYKKSGFYEIGIELDKKI